MPEEHAIAIKLPPFCVPQPEVWFAQAEGQFALRNITTDTTKYYYILTALDNDTVVRVADFIKMQPSENKYESLKNRLVATYARSEYERSSSHTQTGAW